MNKKNLILLIIVAMITISCNRIPHTIRGNKNIITREIDIRDYDEIKISVPVDFEYSQSTSPYLQVTTDENILEYLDIHIEGRTLYIQPVRRNGNIGFSGNLQPTTLKIISHSSGLSDVKSSGSAVFRTMNPLYGNSLEFDMSGSGKIFFNDSVIVNRLSIEISGSGELTGHKTIYAESANVEISGSGKANMAGGHIINGEINISGSGSMHAVNTSFGNLSCRISGSGSISASVTESLSYRISGSGKISYRGNPSLNGQISGSGKIIHLD